MHENELQRRVAESFAVQLNEHGHGFHYAVLNKVKELEEEHRSSWRFEVAEFPVKVDNRGTRIDFVLMHKEYPLLMVAECKRSNPAYAWWCFIRAPYERSGRSADQPMVEQLVYFNGKLSGVKGVALGIGSITGYHIALPVATGQKGDSGGQPRQMIEDAATQVIRSTNGLINFLGDRRASVIGGLNDRQWNAHIMNVVFTTAQLWTTDAELSATDLATGQVKPDQLSLATCPFVAYQYHVTPDIRHHVSLAGSGATLGEALDSDSVRTIFIVSVDGIEAFMRRGWTGPITDA
jgi:hypothetical protein